MLRPPSTLLVFATTLALAAPATSQSLPGTPSTGELPSGSAAFTRCVAGELSGDHLADVVALRGTEVHFAYGPGLYDAVVTPTRPANDLDVMPSTTPGAKGSLVLVNTTGAQRLVFDPATDTFATTTLATGDWADALLARVADVDDDGDYDVIGLKSDKRTLLVLIAGSSGYTSYAPFTVSQDVVDILPFDRNGDGVSEIALRSATAIAAFDAAGSLLAYHAVGTGGSSDAIARVRESGVDELAWVRRPTSSSDQELVMVRTSGLSSALSIGPKGVVAVTSGDYDADGDVDLLMSQQSAHQLLLYVHDSSGSGSPPISYGSGSGELYPVSNGGSGAATGNQAWPALVDVDNDGDLDLVQPVQQTSELFVYRPRAEDESLLQPVFDPADAWFTYDGSPTSVLHFPVTLPAGDVSGATHIEYSVWRKTDVNVPTEAEAVSTTLYTLFENVTSYEIALEIPESDADFTSIYYFTQRFVTGGATPTAVYPGTAYAYFVRETSASEDNEDYATGQTGAGGSIVIPVLEVEGGIIIDTRDIGVIVPEPDVPDTEDDKTPKPDPAPTTVP